MPGGVFSVHGVHTVFRESHVPHCMSNDVISTFGVLTPSPNTQFRYLHVDRVSKN